MFISSLLPHSELGRSDHQEDAPHFRNSHHSVDFETTLSFIREHQAKDEIRCIKLWGQNARYMTDINHQLSVVAAGLNLANSGSVS